MRTDFHKSSMKYKPKDRKWPLVRIIRAIFFILVGVLIGFAVSQSTKKDKTAPPKNNAQVIIKSDRVTVPVELPNSAA